MLVGYLYLEWKFMLISSCFLSFACTFVWCSRKGGFAMENVGFLGVDSFNYATRKLFYLASNGTKFLFLIIFYY